MSPSSVAPLPGIAGLSDETHLQAWATVDIHQRGYIDAGEFAALLHYLGFDKDSTQVMRLVDENKNGVIERNEFLRFCQSNSAKLGSLQQLQSESEARARLNRLNGIQRDVAQGAVNRFMRPTAEQAVAMAFQAIADPIRTITEVAAARSAASLSEALDTKVAPRIGVAGYDIGPQLEPEHSNRVGTSKLWTYNVIFSLITAFNFVIVPCLSVGLPIAEIVFGVRGKYYGGPAKCNNLANYSISAGAVALAWLAIYTTCLGNAMSGAGSCLNTPIMLVPVALSTGGLKIYGMNLIFDSKLETNHYIEANCDTALTGFTYIYVMTWFTTTLAAEFMVVGLLLWPPVHRHRRN
jgi:hypothetical protein